MPTAVSDGAAPGGGVPTGGIPTGGILQPHLAARRFALERHAPAPALAALVERFWVLSWDLRGHEPHVQETLPHPCVNVVVESDRAGVHGVARRRFVRALAGAGRVVGIKLRPGAACALLGAPAHTLTDRALPLDAVLGARAAAALEVALRDDDVARGRAAAERVLLDRVPAPDDAARLAGRVVDAIVADRAVTRVGDLVARFAIGERALQRIFRRHVGVGPKWVIQRYRLQDAADRLASGQSVPGSRLALELGYYDQAHFIRDFTALVGVSPAEYARAARAADHGGGQSPEPGASST